MDLSDTDLVSEDDQFPDEPQNVLLDEFLLAVLVDEHVEAEDHDGLRVVLHNRLVQSEDVIEEMVFFQDVLVVFVILTHQLETQEGERYIVWVVRLDAGLAHSTQAGYHIDGCFFPHQ